jgi:hypothetical protein
MYNPVTAPNGGTYFLKPVEAAAPMMKMTMRAKAFGLDVPASVQQRADEVIE